MNRQAARILTNHPPPHPTGSPGRPDQQPNEESQDAHDQPHTEDDGSHHHHGDEDDEADDQMGHGLEPAAEPLGSVLDDNHTITQSDESHSIHTFPTRSPGCTSGASAIS